MKREEEKISKLFQQLREADERQMPSFAHAWNAALSRQEKRKNPWNVWRVAVSSALFIVLGAGGASWWMYVRQPSKHLAVTVDSPNLSLESKPDSRLTASPVSPSPILIKNSRNLPRRQRRFVIPPPAASLISQWRSPTESLLQIPGGQLFKHLPRLDESSVNVKATTPEPFN
jgi:hypothetical protein